jgi:hypothetical protein
MDMRRKRIETLYTTFTRNLNTSSIQSYFNVPGQYTLRREDENTLLFEVEHEYIPPCKMDKLCLDTSRHVASFLYRRTKCMFRVIFTNGYPFHPTHWSLVSVKGTEIRQIQRALLHQNHQYQLSWTPAITLETDILNMILQLVCVFELK